MKRIAAHLALFALIAWMLWIPATYTLLMAEIPPDRELRVSRGVISYGTRVARAPTVYVLTDDIGRTTEFACIGFYVESSACVRDDFDGARSLDGKTATIVWFRLPLRPFGTVNRPVSIDVDGVVVLSREDTAKQLRISRDGVPLGYIGGILAIVFSVWIQKRSDRRKRASGNG